MLLLFLIGLLSCQIETPEPEIQRPLITFNTPSDMSVHTGVVPIQFEASASDYFAIAEIIYEVSSSVTQVYVIMTSPSNFPSVDTILVDFDVDTALYSPGDTNRITITASCMDIRGITSVQSQIILQTDNAPPVLYLTSSNNTDLDSSSSSLNCYVMDTFSPIKIVRFYMWNNQGSADSIQFGGSGPLTALVGSGSYTVSIPDTNDIDPTISDQLPDYWLLIPDSGGDNRTLDDVYSMIMTRYAVAPIDGPKLICLEAIDDMGNVSRVFHDFMVSEYEPVSSNNRMGTNLDTAAPFTGPLSSERMAISNTIYITGDVADNLSMDPDPGINRVRIYLLSNNGSTILDTWSTETDGQVEITGGTGNGTGTYTWELASRNLSGYTPGNYLIIIEVRDRSGTLTLVNQYIEIK